MCGDVAPTLDTVGVAALRHALSVDAGPTTLLRTLIEIDRLNTARGAAESTARDELRSSTAVLPRAPEFMTSET
jgi:hypothetical protein